ncbi:MAG: hypothetical protein WC969_06175 [Elusimicrobiota bacterium]
MKLTRERALAAAFAALILLIALWRHDLVAEAARVTLVQLGKGGAARTKVLAEIALLAGIFALVLRALAADFEPRRDLPAALAATLAGYLAETWGTRGGLWVYYTRETPPLWIVPAWTAGTLVIDRLARAARGRLGRFLSEEAQHRGYRILSGLFLLVFGIFVFSVSADPADALLLALLAWALLARSSAEDFWTLATGLVLVFFADLWGTTNGCWSYYTQRSSPDGLATGILFGMFFDAAVVTLCLKGVRLPSMTGLPSVPAGALPEGGAQKK